MFYGKMAYSWKWDKNVDISLMSVYRAGVMTFCQAQRKNWKQLE